MTQRLAQHATFTITRTYDATPARVFAAWSDPKLKALWFGGPAEWDKKPGVFEFRVGGRENLVGTPKGGEPHEFDATYHDIVRNERIIYSYGLLIGPRRISVSLTTVEMVPAGKGTKLTFTEQGVFLDGYEDNGSREHGSNWLLDKLGESLKVLA
jgi:uncharacterized protein YndB with AHSA1/START domain